MLHRYLAGVVLAFMLSAPAQAAPQYVYAFEMTDATCSAPGPSEVCAQGIGTMKHILEFTRMTINGDGIAAGFAELRVHKSGPEQWEDFYNFGFAAITGEFPTIDLDDPMSFTGLLKLSAAVTIGPMLAGSFSMHDTEHDIVMSGDGLWSGTFASDAVSWTGLYPLAFAGEWRLVQVVPEPDAIALLLVALMLIALHKREKARPGQAFA